MMLSIYNKARRNEYHIRKANGLCPRCGEKRSKKSKFILCEKCRGYYREYMENCAFDRAAEKRQKYELLKKQDRCTRCGKKLENKYTNSRCRPCLDKQYNYEKKRRKSNARKENS